jgi:hypothetical protein
LWLSGKQLEMPVLSDSGAEPEKERQRIMKIRAATPNALLASQLRVFSHEAERLQNKLNQILIENDVDTNPLDLSHPLQGAWVYLGQSQDDGATLSWQKLRLMSWRDRYLEYRDRWVVVGLDHVAPLPMLPMDLSIGEVRQMFANHLDALTKKVDELARPLSEELNA